MLVFDLCVLFYTVEGLKIGMETLISPDEKPSEKGFQVPCSHDPRGRRQVTRRLAKTVDVLFAPRQGFSVTVVTLPPRKFFPVHPFSLDRTPMTDRDRSSC